MTKILRQYSLVNSCMREKHIVRANLKGLRESRYKEASPDHVSQNKVDVAELLKQSNQGVDTSQNAEMLAYLYPNKRSVPQLFGNDFQNGISKILIEMPEKETPTTPDNAFILTRDINQDIHSPLLNPVFNPTHEPKPVFDCRPENWPFFAERVALISDINNYPTKCAEEWKQYFENRPMPTDLPNLFHKYLLQMATPMAPYKYTVVQEPSYFVESLNIVPITHVKQSVNLPHDLVNRVCIIHCFSLKRFNRMFHDYLHVLEKVFDVVVCFCIDSPIIRELSPNISFLRIPNFGMDIASKFVAIDYLRSIGYEYEYIFYIHSKTDDIKRHEYIYPFIKNMSKIVDTMNLGSVGGIFHNSIYYGTDSVDWYQMSNSPPIKDNINWAKNECYLQDIAHYMNLPNNLFFPEGNFYILHKDIANEIYTDKNLYNILNAPDSFDYNWVNIFYKLDATCNDAYIEYKTNGLFGNNMQTQLGHSGMADSMVEHMFERIIFSVILKLGRTIEIVSQYKLNKRTQYFTEWINTITDSSDISSHEFCRELYKKPNLTVIACHTYDDTKIDILLHNIAYFMEFSDRVIVVNSAEFEKDRHDVICEKIRAKYPNICINHGMTETQLREYKDMNNDLRDMTLDDIKEHYNTNAKFERRRVPFDCILYLYYIPNDVLACFSKYLYALKQIDVSGFSKIILTNDSYLIVKPLTAFFDLTNRPDIEMSSLVSSNEIEYHHPDFLRCYDASCIHRLVDFYNEGISKINCFNDLIHFYEIPSIYIFTKRNVLYEMSEDYKKNINYDDEMLSHYLNHHDYPIIKYKKLQYTYYSDDAVMPSDFDPDVYRMMYTDLQHLTLDHATDHFQRHGMKEGRTYKRDQTIIIPEYLCDHLPDWIFE